MEEEQQQQLADNLRLLCVACREVPEHVVASGCCHSAYCWECVLRTPHCITCHSAIDATACEASEKLEALVRKSVVRCRNLGCEARFPSSDTAKHLQSCPKELSRCEKCLMEMPNEYQSPHAILECYYRQVQCATCLAEHNFSETEKHLAECPLALIDCASCGESTLRRDAALHEESCPQRPVTCPFYKCDTRVYACKMMQHMEDCTSQHMLGFAEQQQVHHDWIERTASEFYHELKLLQQQNTALQQQNAALSAQFVAMQKETIAALKKRPRVQCSAAGQLRKWSQAPCDALNQCKQAMVESIPTLNAAMGTLSHKAAFVFAGTRKLDLLMLTLFVLTLFFLGPAMICCLVVFSAYNLFRWGRNLGCGRGLCTVVAILSLFFAPSLPFIFFKLFAIYIICRFGLIRMVLSRIYMVSRGTLFRCC